MFTAAETVTLLYSMYFAVQDVHRYRNRHTVLYPVCSAVQDVYGSRDFGDT